MPKSAPNKVSAPRALDIAARPRLFARLDELSTGGLVWISGSAGSGKSALVASYLRERGLTPAWYNVDARDEDPAALFEACRGLLAVLAPRRLPLLPRFEPDSFAVLAAFTQRFFERFFEALPERAVLVFDDYQEAPDGAPFHELVRLALTVRPAERKVLLISRAGPPALLARELVHGRLRELTAREVLLTPEEAQAVASLRAEHALEGPAIAAAHARAEGWMAGFLLLLDAVLPGAKAGEGRLFDYFAAETLRKLQPEAERVLTAAALLPWFDDEILGKLTGSAATSVDSRRLARAGLFLHVDANDPAQPSFRYHALFREFLLARLPRVFSAAELRELELRAAQLCEELDELDDALGLYRRAGDFESMGRLLASGARRLALCGQFRTLWSWLSVLPESTIEEDPWLAYWRAASGGFAGVPPPVTLARYHEACRAFRGAGDDAGRALSLAGCLQAVAFEGNDLRQLDEPAEELAQIEVERLGLPPDLELSIVSGMVLALSFREGELSGVTGPRWLDRALELSSLAANASLRLMVLGQLLFYRGLRGEMAEAGLLAQRIERASEGRDADPIAAATALVARALNAWLQADEDGCIAAVEEGLALTEGIGATMLRDVLLVYGMFGALGKQDEARVSRYLHQLGHQADSGRRLDSGNYHSFVAWAALERRDLPAARLSLAKSNAAALGLGGSFAIALNRMLEALIAAESDDMPAARAAIADCAERERRLGNPGLFYWRKLVEVHLAQRAGQLAAASEDLRAAFARGRELGIYNALWPERRYLAELCAHAIDAGIEPDYARALAQRRKLVAPRSSHCDAAWPARLELRLLGTLAVRVDGVPLRFGAKLPKVPLTLLAALAVLGRDGHELGVEQLTDELWPDSDGDVGVHAFETALYRLRKLLGDESLIRLRAGRLQLDPSSYSSDYGACWALLARVEQAQRQGTPRLALLADFARLRAFRAEELLPGWSAPWILAARTELRQRLDKALRDLIELEEQTAGG